MNLGGNGIGASYVEPGCWPSGAGSLLRGTIPSAWAALTSLNSLGLSGNAISGTLPVWLWSNLSSLTALSVHSNQLTGSFATPATPNNGVSYINVAGNQLGGPLPAFTGWSSLNYLFMGVNQFSGPIPPSWGSLGLTYLYVQRNQLSGSLPDELQNNHHLGVLVAGANNLTGTLPAWLGNMPQLNSIVLNDNQLVGTLPPDLGSLNNLVDLNLAGNAFRGTIPDTYNALTGLTSLNLLRNQLYGTFPPALAAIEWSGSLGPGGVALGALGLDATICSSSYSGPLIDYQDDYHNYQLSYTLPTTCAIRPCPENTWSPTGNDTDGSAGGCQPCPAGLTTGDLGGVSPNATASNHAGVGVCSYPPRAAYLTSGVIAGPVLAFFALIALIISCEKGWWRRVTRSLRLGLAFNRAGSLVSTEVMSAGSSADAKGDTRALLKIDATELQLGAVCGMGFMGTVYSATWRGAPVAVKVFKADITAALGLQSLPTGDLPGSISIVTDKSLTGSHTSSFFSELEMLSSVRHPNILACYAFVVGPPSMLVVELGTAGSLKDLLARTSLAELPWHRRLELCAGVAAGVEFLHSLTPQLIHGDLKSANIVLDGLLVPKIADFGLSFLATGSTTRIGKGTPAYCPPEVARRLPITNEPAIDVYGLGCILNDVAHVNTDDDAPRRLRVEGAPGGDRALTEVGTLEMRAKLWDGNAKVIQIMVSREAADYKPEVAARVPAAMRTNILKTLATQPDARPSAGAVRMQLLAASKGPL